MPLIEGFWIKNFGPLKNIALGTSYLQTLVVEDEESSSTDYRLGPVTLIVGNSDVGKSSLMDAFHFLSDCLVFGVEDSCIKRGGLEAIYTQGGEGPLSIGINFHLENEPIPLTYAVNIGTTSHHTPRVDSEVLVYRSLDPSAGSTPIMLLQNYPKNVKHIVPRDKVHASHLSNTKITDSRHLGLASLGLLEDAYPDVATLKRYLENWYLGCYTPHDALGLSPVVPQKYQHSRGDSLVSCVREMELKNHDSFQSQLDRIAKLLPGVEGITLERTESGRLLLFFKLKDCPVPLTAQRMSDGLLRLFAHLLILEDLCPFPFVGIEEPENGLDQNLLELFVDALIRQVVDRRKTQFFITTHSARMVDRVRPESVWLFEKIDGKTNVRRASDDPEIRSTLSSQQTLADDWFSSGRFMEM